jgi:hypothetical protein
MDRPAGEPFAQHQHFAGARDGDIEQPLLFFVLLVFLLLFFFENGRMRQRFPMRPYAAPTSNPHRSLKNARSFELRAVRAARSGIMTMSNSRPFA